MTNYQISHLIFVVILVIFWTLLVLFGKSKHSFLSILGYFVGIGGGLASLGLGISWVTSDAPIIELATFERYETTLGFIRVYLAGLSILAAVPILVVIKLVLKILSRVFRKSN